jgi:mono/diheme cytochrome c family protein
MKRAILATLGPVLVSLSVAAQSGTPVQNGAPQAAVPAPTPVASHAPDVATPEGQSAIVKQYCSTCHNDRMKSGGLSLAGFDASQAVENAQTVEKMIRKLRAGMMPPAGVKRPDEPTIAALAQAFEDHMDRAAAAHPNPGWRPSQRLNRAEYARAVRDLLDVEVDITAYLPPDTISHGFDNVADVQTFSPTLMEGYLRAASQISRIAVGDRKASATSVTYKLGRTMSQMQHVDGAPFGTRGGTSVVHTFPADGEYVFKMMLHNEPLGGLYGQATMSVLGKNEQVDVSINGERVALLDVNRRMQEGDGNGLTLVTPPIYVKAGPQRVSAAFVNLFESPIDDLLVPTENTLADVSISYGITVLPHLRDFTVTGPHKVMGVSDTPSRRRIFTCRPTVAAEEVACANEIVSRLAAQAYRGAVTAQETQDLMRFYEQGQKNGDFENGIRLALQAILASPRFLVRFETAPAVIKASAARVSRVSDIDLASRLSFFLWGTVPDAELVKLAMNGTLKTPAVLEKQVRRMLADARSEALSTRFAGQWLRLQDLDKIIPDYLLYPDYDEGLGRAMKRETELFFDSIVREDRNVLDLLTADYTFVNERVARHYGIPNVTGSAFRRVKLTDERRRGLLGQGSILTLTSNGDRTSPVMRGKWIMEVLLGSPPPPPPPNVPALEDTKPVAGAKFLSVRERMEEHRKNPACNSCHRVIDPLGLALENFDVTGAWRIKDNEVPVDSTGDLYDGTKMAGPAGLRAALLKHKDAFLLSFTESLLTYGVGRRVEYYDMPAIRTIIRDAARNDNRFSSFVLGVVKSPAFQMTTAEAATLTADER